MVIEVTLDAVAVAVVFFLASVFAAILVVIVVGVVDVVIIVVFTIVAFTPSLLLYCRCVRCTVRCCLLLFCWQWL